MPDIVPKDMREAIDDFLARQFPQSSGTGVRSLRLDVSQPSLHDSKSEFTKELKFVKKSADQLLGIFKGLSEHPPPSTETARGLASHLQRSAQKRNEAQKTLSMSTELVLNNVRRIAYWEFSRQFLFDLYLGLSERRTELEAQEREFWSGRGRSPNHYARALALRLARLWASEMKRRPTIGTDKHGNHPSTPFGRALEELFDIVGVEIHFRLPGEWAVAQLSQRDIDPWSDLRLTREKFRPNMGRWKTNKV